MPADLWSLYRRMLFSRLFELEVTRLWQAGKISGEMHLGIGEEGISAGVLAHLRDGDALALDHRGTPPSLIRGVDPTLLLKELLGHPDGLCRGQGGHMHLFSPELLLASSGIVGAAGPAAVGFALAASRLRPGTVAVGFFGEGALNQGMLLESLNLAAAWKLPVLFVCKDNGWAITTRSASVSGGTPLQRAEGFGLNGATVDGAEVEAVWEAAGTAIAAIRDGAGPFFLHARCVHPEGHLLGYQALRAVRHPVRELGRTAGPLLGAALHPRGASLKERVQALGRILATVWGARQEASSREADPVLKARRKLEAEKERLLELEEEVAGEIQAVSAAAEGGR